MGFWPKGYKSCFFLSFDYDASSAETWKTPDDLSSLSKGRYAPRVAVPRILDLLDRLEIEDHILHAWAGHATTTLTRSPTS